MKGKLFMEATTAMSQMVWINIQGRLRLPFLVFALSVQARSSISKTAYNIVFTSEEYSQCHYCQQSPPKRHCLHFLQPAGSS